MVTSNGSQGSPTPGGDGDQNAEQRPRRPVPTPAEVFPPRRKRPAAPVAPPAPPGEGPGGGSEGRGENSAQSGR